METQILSITIVNIQGVKVYTVGETVNNKVIHKIGIAEMHFTGDPFDHYIGYDENSEIVFTINCLVPCVVEYK